MLKISHLKKKLGLFVAKIADFGRGKNILVPGVEISQLKAIIQLRMRGKASLSDMPILIYCHLANLDFFAKTADFELWKDI